MVVFADVPGHGNVPVFRDENDLMDYDASNFRSGQPTFAVGVKFGCQQNVTAVASTGQAVLKNNLSGSGSSAPMPLVNGKPTVLEHNSIVPGPRSSGDYYGVFGLDDAAIATIITIIKLIVVIMAIIAACYIATILSKAMEATNPKSSTYTDAQGNVHTVYTSGGGLFGSGKVIDLNNSTGLVTNIMGGGIDFMAIGVGCIGITVVAVAGYFVYTKFIKKKVGMFEKTEE